MKYFLIILLFVTTTLRANDPIILSNARIHPVSSKNGMVVSQDELATEAALDVLENGGNAADAAVALAYVLAVTQPKAGNIGGGGFAVYYEAKSKKSYAIDFRESAPNLASEEMFLDKAGNVITGKSAFSLDASGVPGTVAGLDYISSKFGKISHPKLIKPAIELARKGFPVSAGLAYDLKFFEKELSAYPEMVQRFYVQGRPLEQGEILKLPILANTLKTLQKEGPESFYKGSISKKLVEFFQKNGGRITSGDLAEYRVRSMAPISGEYRGYRIISMPPPSSGGIHIIQMLNILEGFNLSEMGHNTSQTVHVMTEAMKMAFADRSTYPGDPEYYPVPQKGLISKTYANELRKKINLQKAIPGEELAAGNPLKYESPETTHFSIADSEGNVISVTYTINFSFGSRIIVPELGFILNNEMDDFAVRTNTPNALGLVGGKANSVQAGKRPLSSMSPVIVMKEGKPWLVTGSPGGSRIINAVLQVILNVIDHKMNIAEATIVPRIHHQWKPDVLNVERGFNKDTYNLLDAMGQKIKFSTTIGCTETIQIENGIFYGFADPRRKSGKAAGY